MRRRRTRNIHWLSMTALLEDLRRHIPRRTAGCRENVELFLVHDAGQSEIGNQEVSVILRRAKQQILRLQVTVHDAVIVQVGDGRQDGADEIRGVGLEVAAFTTDAIEELSTQREISNEVYCRDKQQSSASSRLINPTTPTQQNDRTAERTVIHRLEVIHQGQNILMTHRHPFQDRYLISNL